jgi:hypothetical protein
VACCVASSENIANAFSKEFSEFRSIRFIGCIEDVCILLIVDKRDQILKLGQEDFSAKGCYLLGEQRGNGSPFRPALIKAIAAR